MYIYACSSDNLATHPNNIPESFTFTLSQPLRGLNCRLGLVELSLQPASAADIKRLAGDGYVYIIVRQCRHSEAHSHRHPIIRRVGLHEYSSGTETSVIRFPTVQYVDIKDYQLSDITVDICSGAGRDNTASSASCCAPTVGVLKGPTRCTFHIIGHDV